MFSSRMKIVSCAYTHVYLSRGFTQMQRKKCTKVKQKHKRDATTIGFNTITRDNATLYSLIILQYKHDSRPIRPGPRRLQEGSQVRRPSQQLHFPTNDIRDAGPTQFLHYGLCDKTWSSAISIRWITARDCLSFFSVCQSLFKGSTPL